MMEPREMTLDQMGAAILETVRQLKAEGRYHPPTFEQLMLELKKPVGKLK
jgi:hypothetical protein